MKRWRAVFLLSFALMQCFDVYNADTSNEQAPSLDSLDLKSCYEHREDCCDELDLGDVNVLRKCAKQHSDKMPAENEKNTAKLVKFISCLVECTYKKKKYIGRGDTLNMKMVKNDAEKMFAKNPKERDYYVAMHEYCATEATEQYNGISGNPAGQVLLKDVCKPYFMFVYLCTSKYHQEHECPYFKWEGKEETSAEQDCADAQSKCLEIDRQP